MDVIWSTTAKENIGAIKNEVLRQFGERVTIEFLTKLLSAVDVISLYPEIGKRFRENMRVFVVVKHISIYYRISDQIEIVMLRDNRRMLI